MRVEETTVAPPGFSGPSRKSLAIYIGLLLLSVGVFLSPAVLEILVLPEGSLVGTRRRLLAWVVCRVLMAGIGAYFLLKRPRFTIVHLSALIFGSMITVLLTAVFFQILY